MDSYRIRSCWRKLHESSFTTDPHVCPVSRFRLWSSFTVLTFARSRYSQVFGCSRFLLTDWKSHVAVHARVYGGTEASAPKRATLAYYPTSPGPVSSFDPFALGPRHALAMLAIDAMRSIGILDPNVRRIQSVYYQPSLQVFRLGNRLARRVATASFKKASRESVRLCNIRALTDDYSFTRSGRRLCYPHRWTRPPCE